MRMAITLPFRMSSSFIAADLRKVLECDTL
jgi:hypothetical protein